MGIYIAVSMEMGDIPPKKLELQNYEGQRLQATSNFHTDAPCGAGFA